MDHAFGVVSKYSSPTPRSHRFPPMFSSRRFVVLYFIYLYLYLSVSVYVIPLELISVKFLGLCVGVLLLFLVLFFLASFVEKTIFSSCNSFCTLVKDQLITYFESITGVSILFH